MASSSFTQQYLIPIERLLELQWSNNPQREFDSCEAVLNEFDIDFPRQDLSTLEALRYSESVFHSNIKIKYKPFKQQDPRARELEALVASKGETLYMPQENGKCLICSLDEHTSFECPYNAEVPKNAIVGKAADILCKMCNGLFSGRCCNQVSGRARLKSCMFCKNCSEHWTEHCWRCPQGHLPCSME